MQSKAATVADYLKELPADRRAAISRLRQVIRKHLPKGVAEGMQYGMIGYFIPHRIYPPGYHCDPRQPLPFAALAAQKNYLSVYLCSIYQNPDDEQWVRDRFAEHGKKPDMGKSLHPLQAARGYPAGGHRRSHRPRPRRRLHRAIRTMLAARRKK